MTALPADVRILLAQVLRPASYALAAVAGPAAVIVVVAGRDPELAAAAARELADAGHTPHETPHGHWIAALPLERARQVAAVLAPTLADALDASPGAGAAWVVLLLAPRGAAVVPLVPRTGRGSRMMS